MDELMIYFIIDALSGSGLSVIKQDDHYMVEVGEDYVAYTYYLQIR